MAFGSVSDILLRITGDPSDASEAIAELAGELAVFSKQKAEAEADVATSEAMDKLRLMRERLEALDLSKAEPEVKAKVAIALAELEIVQAKMQELDGEDVTVDVDVRRGTLERLGAVSTKVLGLTSSVRKLGDSGDGLASSFSNVGTVMGPFTARLGQVGPLLLALSGPIAAIVAAVVALVSSLAQAAAGLGALAVAFGGVLTVGLGLGIAAIARFKQEADTAGTPANALKNAFQGIGDAAKKLLPAVDPVFKAMAAGLNGLKPLLGFIAPAFRQFGQAAADSVRAFIDVLSSPAIASGIRNLIGLASGALQPLAQIAGQLFRIFLNIGQAAMPALVSGLQAAAGAIKGIADGTGNIGQLRSQINGLVGVLSEWLKLLGAVGDALVSIVSASAGPGTELVKWLTDGAQALADWAKSSDGQAKIKQFFADTLPLAKALVELALNLGLAFIQFGQLVAPIMAPLVQALNFVLQVLNFVLSKVNEVSPAIRSAFLSGPILAVVFTVQLLIGVLGQVIGVLGQVIGFMATIPGTAARAFQGIIGAASSVIATVRGLLAAPISFVLHLPTAAAGLASSLWANVKGTISAVIGFVFNVPRAALGIARTLWSGVRGVISAGISFAFSVPRTALGLARSLWSAVRGVITAAIQFVIHLPSVGSLTSVAHSIWSAIKAALPDITIHIHIPTPSIPHISIPGVATGVRNFLGGNALVGEQGPELVNLPKGSDVFTARDTRNILEKLARAPNLADLSGALSVRGDVPATGAGTVINNIINAPAGEQPDATTTLALMDMKLRARGVPA